MDNVTLKRFRAAVMVKLSQQLMDSVNDEREFDVVANYTADSLSAVLRQSLYGETLEDVTLKYPADWIEAVKERWLPAWAKRHWPIRYTSHHVTIAALHPMVKPTSGNVVFAKVHDLKLTDGV